MAQTPAGGGEQPEKLGHAIALTLHGMILTPAVMDVLKCILDFQPQELDMYEANILSHLDKEREQQKEWRKVVHFNDTQEPTVDESKDFLVSIQKKVKSSNSTLKKWLDDQGWQFEEGKNKENMSPGDIMYSIVIEMVNSYNGDKGTILSTPIGDLMIKNYLVVIMKKLEFEYVHLRLTSKDNWGIGGVTPNARKEYAYVQVPRDPSPDHHKDETHRTFELERTGRFEICRNTMVHLVPRAQSYKIPLRPTGLRIARIRDYQGRDNKEFARLMSAAGLKYDLNDREWNGTNENNIFGGYPYALQIPEHDPASNRPAKTAPTRRRSLAPSAYESIEQWMEGATNESFQLFGKKVAITIIEEPPSAETGAEAERRLTPESSGITTSHDTPESEDAVQSLEPTQLTNSPTLLADVATTPATTPASFSSSTDDPTSPVIKGMNAKVPRRKRKRSADSSSDASDDESDPKVPKLEVEEKGTGLTQKTRAVTLEKKAQKPLSSQADAVPGASARE